MVLNRVMNKSIVLGTISLNNMAGGLEKNIVLLANNFVNEGANVNLISFDLPDAVSFYKLDSRVKWIKVGKSRPHAPISFKDRLALIFSIRKTISSLHDPVVICFHHGILFRFILASCFLSVKIICSERNSLSLYQHIRQSKWTLNFLLLSLVDRITVQFPIYINDYPFWLRSRIRVVSNPVFPVKELSKPDKPNADSRFSVLTVGRLCAQKKQNELILAFNSICEEFPEWDLYIIGDGTLSADLQCTINEFSLNNRVFLKGQSDKVESWFLYSHLFCLPSKWEGFPNALAEAMAFGLPSIGYSSCAGVRDLIKDGTTGLLSHPNDLSKSLSTLMSSKATRKNMGFAAVKEIEQYSPENTFNCWDKILDELTN